MTKYKHIPTGNIWTLGEYSSYGHKGTAYKIPLEIVESGGKDWEKIEEPEKKPVLFVTEDGKEIFKGDPYFWLKFGFEITEIHAEEWSSYDNNVKRFSTKDAAEEWVIQNKTVFSFNDFKQIFSHAPGYHEFDRLARERCGFKKKE